MFAVVAAVEAGGSLDQVLQRLTAQPEEDLALATNMSAEANSTFANNSTSSSAPLPDNTDDTEGLPGNLGNVEERDLEMEDELSADIAKADDAWADYDIEVNIEGEAITEYLTLLDSAGSSSGQKLASQ